MANDNRPALLLDVTISTHGLKPKMTITGCDSPLGDAALLDYFVDNVRVLREDFLAVMELHALVARARLMPQ